MDFIFLYTVNPDSDEPIMLIDKHIGFDEADGYGIMGDLFQKELLQLDQMEKKRIQVWINCPGGDVAEGYNMYNAMLKTKTKVDTYCFGMAASMAAVLFQAGRKRVMADYAWLMYHNPYSPSGGKNDALDTFTESIAKMVANRCGKTEEEIKAIMKKTTYIMAEEALAEGLCDEVEHSADYNKKRPMPTEAKAFWKESNKVVNKLFPSTQTINMKKVANKLNLNQEASEDAIVAEIESVQNKVTNLQNDVTSHLATIKNKDSEIEEKAKALKAKEEEVKNLQAEIDAMKAKAQEEEAKAKAKAEEEEATKAKNMIEGYVKQGRIKNEESVIKEWTDNAKVLGIDKVKNMIESLPVNRVSAKITVNTQTQHDARPGSVIRNTMVNKLSKLQGQD